MMRKPGPLVFLILTLLTFCGGVAGIYFGVTNLGKAELRLLRVRKDIRPESAVKRDLRESEARLGLSAGKLQHLESSVAVRAYVPSLLAELEALGQANGITITGVRPMEESTRANSGSQKQSPGKKTGYEELIVEVKGSGLFGAVHGFVASLQEFPKIVAIRSMDLAPRRGARPEERGQLEMTLELRAFLFPPAPAEDGAEPETKGQTGEKESNHEVG